MMQTYHKVDNWNILKTRLVSARMKVKYHLIMMLSQTFVTVQTSIMAFIVVANQEFQIMNKIGAGGFSRVYEVRFCC